MMRKAALAMAAALVAAGAVWAWIDMHAAERERALVALLRSLRAGLACTLSRAGELPATLDPAALPGLCRNLTGPAALELLAGGHGLGYQRLTADRYRICAAVPGRRPILRDGPMLDDKGCFEERLLPAEGARRPARKHA
ncbi:MAG TPA: hypothetical protein VFR34_07175 [Paracoccaceae bacterium]|nr:hypothetical protein [Paracoccaceae bacterium]